VHHCVETPLIATIFELLQWVASNVKAQDMQEARVPRYTVTEVSVSGALWRDLFDASDDDVALERVARACANFELWHGEILIARRPAPNQPTIGRPVSGKRGAIAS
jgi:hypothetical protein